MSNKTNGPYYLEHPESGSARKIWTEKELNEALNGQENKIPREMFDNLRAGGLCDVSGVDYLLPDTTLELIFNSIKDMSAEISQLAGVFQNQGVCIRTEFNYAQQKVDDIKNGLDAALNIARRSAVKTEF